MDTKPNSVTPSNANENCVGPSNPDAGKAKSCEGCPNQSVCKSGKAAPSQAIKDAEHEDIRTSFTNIKQVILVMSGKGGVGKSTMCCQLAFTLESRGYRVGVLDVDICGPSVAQMLGVTGREVHRSGCGLTPVYAKPDLAVMSVSFLLPDTDAAVVWRGPRKNGMIKQFLTDTDWDEEVDFLLIDTPPGTSDEHISTVQYLQGALSQEGKLSGAIIVTTPEEVAMADVRKELNFCKKTNLPVIGVVENMSSFQLKVSRLKFLRNSSSDSNLNNQQDCTNDVIETLRTKCPEVLDLMVSADIFPRSGSGPEGMAKKFNVPFLGEIPLDSNLLLSCENGVCFVEAFPDSLSVPPLNFVVDNILDVLPSTDD